MTVDEQLVAKRPLIERLARTFIRRTPWIEYDDAVQVVSLAAWRVLSHPEAAERNVDAQIVSSGIRRLIDEVRTGTTGGLSRSQLKAGAQMPLSLNKHVRGEDGTPTEFLELLADPDDGYEDLNNDQMPSLAAALAALSERDRLVVYLRYYEGLTMAAIAELLDVTEGRISQLLTRAHERMRPLLAA